MALFFTHGVRNALSSGFWCIKYAKRILNENRGKTPSMIAPGTKVHELVEELAKYLPEEIKGRFLEQE